MRIVGVIVVLVVGLCHFLLLDDVVGPQREAVRVTFSAAQLALDAGPSFVTLLLLAGVIGAAACGPAERRDGLRFLVGRPLDAEALARASRFLLAAARAAVAGGLVLGFCGALTLLALPRDRAGELFPAHLAAAQDWALFAGMGGLVVGRLVLGALAEGARHRAGSRGPVHFSFAADLGLLAVLAIPPLLMLAMTTPIGRGP